MSLQLLPLDENSYQAIIFNIDFFLVKTRKLEDKTKCIEVSIFCKKRKFSFYLKQDEGDYTEDDIIRIIDISQRENGREILIIDNYTISTTI